ncbi:hypothetical protein BDF19DRAFT_452601 [Syncephalis fuscata]|nr:hypothetical protein BDF19DRAFT_452601 [Syncephalis fuscata]
MDSFRISLRPKHPGVQPQLHHLPCSIDHHGSANVNIFFCPELKSTTETDEWQASFRGRALVGRTISVPTGYEGH